MARCAGQPQGGGVALSGGLALLFRFLSATGSREAYLAARQEVANLSRGPVVYLQQVNVAAGLQHHVMPFEQITCGFLAGSL